MNLQLLQTNLADILKGKQDDAWVTDVYLSKVVDSPNLQLAKKVLFWWRKIQIEDSCILTPNLLKAQNNFETAVQAFIAEGFSAYRQEAGLGFLQHVISRITDPLMQSVAAFEYALIQVKLGANITTNIHWLYEPYSIISALVSNTFDPDILQSGEYEVEVSYLLGEQLFEVHELFTE